MSAHRKRRSRRSWRPSWLSWLIVVLGLLGCCVYIYPMAAAWFSSYSQSRVLDNYATSIAEVEPDASQQLKAARLYNEYLSAGVKVESNANVPVSDGKNKNTTLKYAKMLRADKDGLMARVKIPSIEVDLPVFHGTSEETLLRGAGHLEGSHLPVGGVGTHAVITAHRGLATATMFDNLDKVKKGEHFVIEVFGQVLSYRVTSTKIIEPEDTAALRPKEGVDQITLITCTPLGINSHRYLLTGERITPTPDEDVAKAGQSPDIPGFPWWVLILGGALLLTVFYLWRAGYTDARITERKKAGNPK